MPLSQETLAPRAILTTPPPSILIIAWSVEKDQGYWQHQFSTFPQGQGNGLGGSSDNELLGKPRCYGSYPRALSTQNGGGRLVTAQSHRTLVLESAKEWQLPVLSVSCNDPEGQEKIHCDRN